MTRAVCLAALALAALAACGGPAAPVTVSPATHDFGRVLQGDTPEARFTISNHSDRVVKFRAQANCKCFGVNQGLVPLEPGASRDFRVIFNSTALSPQAVKSKWVTIRLDHPDMDEIVVPLTGEIFRAYTIVPPNFKLGRIDGSARSYAKRVAAIRPESGYRLKYVGSKQWPDVFTVEGRDAGGGGVDVSFQLKKDVRRPLARFQAKVRLDIELTAPDGSTRVDTPTVDFQGLWTLR